MEPGHGLAGYRPHRLGCAGARQRLAIGVGLAVQQARHRSQRHRNGPVLLLLNADQRNAAQPLEFVLRKHGIQHDVREYVE